MIKRYLLVAATTFSLVPTVHAQSQVKPCSADEMRQMWVEKNPKILEIEQEIERQIKEGIKHINLSTFAKKTAGDQTNNPDFWYDIPIVIHIVHDYNTYNTSTFIGDFIPDDFIYKAVRDWNIVFAKQNADTADVIQPFKKYIGNAHIRLHLATVDPNGNPTKGITRRRSYLTYTGGDQAKFDGWPRGSYMNIWCINRMSDGHSSAAAYAYQPPTAAGIPMYDGVIALASYLNNGSKTIPHELGHCLNLAHPWGNTNQPGVACGDDNVDDTPPTKGHNTTGCTAASIYDSSCATNYFKIYTDSVGHIELVDYPDTTNAQNLMDYTYCDKMFTKGQVERMHLALNSDVADRNVLWDSTNLVMTGALASVPDIKPTPDFSVTLPGTSSYLTKNGNFAFPGRNVKFTNYSYNDTVENVDWEFTNGSTVVTKESVETNFDQTFTDAGWYDVKMTVTGNNSGDTTRVWPKAIYVPDATGVNLSAGYIQEFADGSDRDKWAMFNYYNNEFKWELSDHGVWDSKCIKYNGFDNRVVSAFNPPYTGTPEGDIDDLFSVPVDLTTLGGSEAYLTFFYSGATRSSISTDVRDTLQIEYSINKSNTWTTLAKLGKADIFNKGTVNVAYTPAYMSDWEMKGIKLPAAAITPYTVFRFRYRPGANLFGTSTGNNFYLDRVSFSPWNVGVNPVDAGTVSVMVVPNPTQGDASVIINDLGNSQASIAVSDITGKVVYNAEVAVSSNQARVVIPASAISVKGMYLVNVKTGNQVATRKLVVY